MPSHGSLSKEEVNGRMKWSDFERGFLVGMIEGEGSISFYRTGKKNDKSFVPSLKIANTDKETMEYVSKLLGQKIYVYNKKGAKPLYIVHIFGLAKLKAVLEPLVQDLKAKKRLAELVLAFVDSRLKVKGKYIIRENRKGHKYPTPLPLTSEELEIIKVVRRINKERKGARKHALAW